MWRASCTLMSALGRALAVKPSVVFWDRLKALYLAARGPGEMEGLAVALAASATSAHFEDLVALLAETSRGSTRIHIHWSDPAGRGCAWT